MRGESAMIFKDDIGTRVVHTYLAYNAGPWRVRDLELVVYWPIQVANNKPQGKWLLYLDETPTIEGMRCFFLTVTSVAREVIGQAHYVIHRSDFS